MKQGESRRIKQGGIRGITQEESGRMKRMKQGERVKEPNMDELEE